MKIKIDDSNQLLKFACEDLQALQAVILAAEENADSCEKSTGTDHN